MKTTQSNSSVYYASSAIRTISSADIMEIVEKFSHAEEKISRICMHMDNNDKLHEMIISVKKGFSYPPHMHTDSEESINIVYGSAILHIYDEYGDIIKSIPVSSSEKKSIHYIRIKSFTFHSLEIKSDIVVYFETKNGPFNPDANIKANFSTLHKDKSPIDNHGGQPCKI